MPTRMWTSHYKLVDTTIPNYKPQHEKDFFDGIDTTLLGLSNIAPNAALLKPGLLELTGFIDEASGLVEKDQKAAAVPLLKGFAKTKELIEQAKNLPISATEQQELLVQLEAKRDQFRDAGNFALGVTLTATAELPAMKEVNDPAAQMWLAAVPASDLKVQLTSVSPVPVNSKLFGPIATVKVEQGNKMLWTTQRVASNAAYTRQYWHRDDPDRESIYKIDDPQYQTLPLTPWPFVAHGTYQYQGLTGEIESTVEVATPKPHPLIVGPALSLLVPQTTIVVPADSGTSSTTAIWKSNLPESVGPKAAKTKGTLAAGTRSGLRPDRNHTPPAVPYESVFNLFVPPNGKEDKRGNQFFDVELNGSTFAVGYSTVTRDDLGTAYYFRKATQPVSIVDVKVPQNLRVGYIMGVGDDIPDVLRSIGINVTIIPADSLATADLAKFDTIVLGIRTYDSQPALKANNARLLDFVKNGGTMMVQYIYNTDAINGMTPYPLTLGRNNSDRVVEEDAPVTILASDNPIFKSPNPISLKDFNEWVQERALYSPTTWDSHYQPLLESKDSDGPAIKGGLLVAHTAKAPTSGTPGPSSDNSPPASPARYGCM